MIIDTDGYDPDDDPFDDDYDYAPRIVPAPPGPTVHYTVIGGGGGGGSGFVTGGGGGGGGWIPSMLDGWHPGLSQSQTNKPKTKDNDMSFTNPQAADAGNRHSWLPRVT